MSRKIFLTIAGAIGVLFGLYMLISPAAMMKGMGVEDNAATNVVLQATSIMLLCTGIMLLLARNDNGSVALRAILISSILVHFGDLPVDWIAYNNGTFTQLSGIIPGTVVHVLLGLGFIYYFAKMKKPAPGEVSMAS